MTIREFIARTEAIAPLGSLHYFDPDTIATGKEHNLDGFRFYFLGRGGVLGDVEPEVVASAFGYWNPALITKMWNSGKERMAPRDAARLYLSCCHQLARKRVADVPGLDEFCDAAEQVRAEIDPAGLAMYAGLAAEPLPDDAPARALHHCVVLREARGSAHLVGVVAAGLRPRMAHAVKRPDDSKMFGWDDEPVPTDDERARWDEAEEITLRQLETWFGVLGDHEQGAFLNGLDGMQAALQ